jgi:hypothetical protein
VCERERRGNCIQLVTAPTTGASCSSAAMAVSMESRWIARTALMIAALSLRPYMNRAVAVQVEFETRFRNQVFTS